MTRARGSAVAAAVLLVVLAGCGAGPASPSTAASTAAPTASPAPPTSQASAALPSDAALPSATAPAGQAGPIVEDESLLAVLPEDVAGTPIRQEHAAFVEVAADPAFVSSIGSAVLFVAPGPSDIVSGLVAKPREGVFGDPWYRDWRETYDEGACGQAGGVGARAEAGIGGRTVYITTCAGGMRVYHAWVREQAVVVSLLSLGDGRWGEQVMGSLRP